MVCNAVKTPAKSLSSIRNPLLYPAELRAQLRSEVAASECHVQVFPGSVR
jgi:hypothetical protein